VPKTRRTSRLLKLEAVAEINPAPPPSSRSKDAPILILGLESVSDETGLINLSKTEKVSKAPANTLIVQSGDILMAKNSPPIQRGKIAIVTGMSGLVGISSANFHVIRPRQRLSSRWLWYFLRQRIFRERVEQVLFGGEGRRQLLVHFLKHLRIPLPSLSTQQRIIRLLDNITAARSLQNESILAAEKIGSTLFREMFGDPEKNPKKWKRGKLSELVRISVGVSKSLLTRPVSQGEWAVVTPSSVTSGLFNPAEVLPLLDRNSTPVPIAKGDLLMSWTNNSELVGTVALVEGDVSNLFLPDTLWKLVPKPRVSTCFVKELLSTPFIRQRVRELATGTVRSTITASKLMELPVIKPQQQLQARFAKIYWELPGLRRSQETLIAALDRLQASLLTRIFPYTETITETERAVMKKPSRRSSKKSSRKTTRKRVSKTQASVISDRIIWDKLSLFQRSVWTKAQTFTGPFRAADLVLAVNQNNGKPASRESIMISVELLVSLGMLIKEGRQDADRWRVPNPETDREIEV
jgi:type I restriction enzyme, S subunit